MHKSHQGSDETVTPFFTFSENITSLQQSLCSPSSFFRRFEPIRRVSQAFPFSIFEGLGQSVRFSVFLSSGNINQLGRRLHRSIFHLPRTLSIKSVTSASKNSRGRLGNTFRAAAVLAGNSTGSFSLKGILNYMVIHGFATPVS